MKPVLQAAGVLIFGVGLLGACVSPVYAAPKNKAAKKQPTKAPAKSSESEAKPMAPEPSTAGGPQGPRGAKVSSRNELPSPRPIPATIGTLGFFTLESGDTLPKRNFGLSGYVNKFSRKPGDIAIVNWGWNVSAGLSDRVSVYFQWEPHRHIHVGNPIQLSFRSPGGAAIPPVGPGNPQFDSTIYRSLLPVVGNAPGYVEDFPFAGVANTGGPGDVTVGLKYNIWSEWRGDPVSISVRNDFHIPTRTQLTDLLGDGSQAGQFNDTIAAALSKTWAHKVQGALNWGYRITRDPRNTDGTLLLQQADQVKVGAGFLVFPDRRFQLMNEYTGLIFLGTATPNTTFGARDPIDGVWGVRMYPWKNMGVDLGYRYMLNLKDHGDRNGFVIKVGWLYTKEVAAKPVPNRPPTAACSASRSAVYAGSGDAVDVNVQASDPDNDPLTYSWVATGGRVDGSGSGVRWNSAGLGVGNYTITARVDDGHGGSASCAVDVKVEARPNRPPTLSCAADRTSVFSGERVRISGNGADPDNDPLAYSWRTNGGRITGSGDSVTLDTSDVQPGRYTVTGRVEDGRGGAADCTVGVEVKTAPPTPVASKLNECFFRASSARVDNVCKRILDDVALRLQNDPKAKVVLSGYGDPKEPKKIAEQRSDAAKKYLEGKGIAASRMDLRPGSGKAGEAKQNRRLDVIWVPEGATY